MKEFQGKSGGRRIFNEDFENLQELALSATGLFVAAGIDFVISGCEVTMTPMTIGAGNTFRYIVSDGLVFINGKIRKVKETKFDTPAELSDNAIQIYAVDIDSGHLITYADGTRGQQFIDYAAAVSFDGSQTENCISYDFAKGEFPNLRSAYFDNYCIIKNGDAQEVESYVKFKKGLGTANLILANNDKHAIIGIDLNDNVFISILDENGDEVKNFSFNKNSGLQFKNTGDVKNTEQLLTKIASLETQLSNARNRIAALEELVPNINLIPTLVEQVNTLAGQVAILQTSSNQIPTLSTRLSAVETSINEQKSVNTNIQTSINSLTENKANKTDVSASISTLSASVSSLNSSMSGKAEKTDMENKLAQKADKTETSESLSTLSASVSSLNSSMENKADKSDITALGSRVSALETNVGNKADKSTVSTLQNTVTSLQTDVNKKAVKSEVDSVINTINNNLSKKADSETMTTQLANKADKGVVETLSGRVTTLGTNLSGVDGETIRKFKQSFRKLNDYVDETDDKIMILYNVAKSIDSDACDGSSKISVNYISRYGEDIYDD